MWPGAWHGVEMQESVKALEMCSTDTFRKPFGITAPPSLMPALPFGAAVPLGRYSAELQVLVFWDVVLELVGFEEVAQLLHVALVQPVHLLLGGMWCLRHLDGLSHCKTQRWVVAQSRNYWGFWIPWGRTPCQWSHLLESACIVSFQPCFGWSNLDIRTTPKFWNNKNTSSWHCHLPDNVLGALLVLAPKIFRTILWGLNLLLVHFNR